MDGYSPQEVRAWVTASCDAQGLPVVVTDPATLARVAALLGSGSGNGAQPGVPRALAPRAPARPSRLGYLHPPQGLDAGGIDPPCTRAAG